MKQTVDMVVRFGPAESVMQVMTFQSHNQYPQLKESDAINDITAKTCQSETSTTNLNENFKTCCLFSIGEILFPIDSWEARFFFSPHFRTISSKLGVFCLSWNHRHLATIDLDCEWAPRRHSLDMCHSKWLASTNVILQNIHIELVCASSWTGGHFPGCDVKSQSVLTRLAGSLLLFLTLLFLLQEEAFLHDTAMYQSDSIYSAPLRTKCYSKTLEWCRQR